MSWSPKNSKDNRPLRFVFSAVLLLLAAGPAHAQLPGNIQAISAHARGRVGVACSLPGVALDCNLHERQALPMQSVYKLPIAMAVLHQVEEGRLSLTQRVRFLPSDCISRTQHSPLQHAHPEGNVDVMVEELLRLTVEQSDGAASDVLLRIIGGPQMADTYVRNLGIEGIHIRDTEKTLGINVAAQYRNDAEPAALVRLLRLIADHPPLTPEHMRLLRQWMVESPTGAHRIKGLLPADTIVAHKTGSSGEENGIAAATNDIGLITLPDGRTLALAVMVADSPQNETEREAVIAEITRQIWLAATGSTQGN
jgi:beta-lactamase class A